MPLIKKIDVFVLKKFFLLFLGCFCICLFVFMMQFVWKHVNDLVGKGLGMDVLAQFFWYMALTLVPMALPMAVLLTSLISFGNMGEQLELTAFKAAGVPLIRIMRSVLISCVMLMCVSFYFQNNISPRAQMQLARLLISMKDTSPALEIPEGVFYNGIPNVNIYVERKTAETGMLYNVIIYKMDQGIDNAQIVVADSAKIETTADKQHLKLTIFNGEQFENLQANASGLLNQTQVPYDRETFQYKILLIDYNSDFDLMSADDLQAMAETKSLAELQADADSMTMVYDSLGRVNYLEMTTRYMQSGYMTKQDSALAAKQSLSLNIDTILASAGRDHLPILHKASSTIDNINTELEWRTPVSQDGYRIVRKHLIKWHEKFTNALACLFFFFIGAPLGAIIRKGGLGVSTIVSVLVFIIYYIIGISGMKMARDGSWDIVYGMWISTVVMTPLGIFLTYRANRDSIEFNFDNIKQKLVALNAKLKYLPGETKTQRLKRIFNDIFHKNKVT